MIETKDDIYISWEEYLHAIDVCIQCIQRQNHNFKSIFAPIRGGLIPAVMMSHYFKTPMYTLDTRRPSLDLQDNTPTNAGNVLLIDDISDTGKTLSKCCKYLESIGYKVITCTVVTKEHSTSLPDVTAFKFTQDKYVVFPYERER